MLIPRVIPLLLLYNEGFVKTIQFGKPLYIGDPVNVINLFNRFEVDEIALLDIRATLENRPPNFDMINQLASECWVPLSYGGGITTLNQMDRIFQIGVEKVILNSALESHPTLLKEAAKKFGSQAVVASIDVKKTFFGGYKVYVKSGQKKMKIDLVTFAKKVEEQGAGEIFLNAIHKDGKMNGYDIELISLITEAVNIPVIACGGAGHRNDLGPPILQGNASAVAAGSIFVFKGKERGVLINYPERGEIEVILKP